MCGFLLSVIPKRKMALAVYGVLPAKFSDEIRKDVQAVVQSVIGKMSLVTRKEFEEKDKRLLQLHEKIEATEQLVAKSQGKKQTAGKREQLA